MEIKERIAKIMQKEGMNAGQFAAEIGIQSSTLSHILKGRNNPSLDVIKKILNRFENINSDWLILGVGPMYRIAKQSNAPSLFDEEEIENFKPISTTLNYEEENLNVNSLPHKTKSELDKSSLNKSFATSEQISSNIQKIEKSVKKIIVYFSDNTFQEFESKET